DKGLVIKASQKAGSKLKPDTEVDLVISDGRRPIEITDWTGKDAGAARDALKEAGFAVDLSRQHSDSVPKGQVIEQSPDDGTGYAKDTIELVESLGPVM